MASNNVNERFSAIECSLPSLGLDPAQVTDIALIGRRHGHALYRVSYGPSSFVLKWFEHSASAVEVRGYALLDELGVPTLSVHRRTDNALLLEDLTTSRAWRPATEADMAVAATGIAVAGWYRRLHAAGRALLAAPQAPPGFLTCEADVLTPASIFQLGKNLGLEGDAAWRRAAENIEVLKRAMRALPETLTYNDFHWTNLALSREDGPMRHAIVYDYHLLGIGLPHSDCRNVAGSLQGRARAAFWEAYGPMDEREAVLDALVAVLAALHDAAQRPYLPSWGRALRQEVVDGVFQGKLQRALDLRPP